MKKIILSLSFFAASSVYAFMNTYDPRMMQPQQMGYGPAMMQMGEQPTNMMNGQVCPPQMAPMQAPLSPQTMMPMMNQYNQGIHGQQIYRMQ